jgi:hypothetical protein
MIREPIIGHDVYDVGGETPSLVFMGTIYDLVNLCDITDDAWKIWLSDDERDYTYINQKEAWSDKVNAWVVDHELAKEYGLL